MSGGVHQCFASWMEFIECYSEEPSPAVMCRDQFEDYEECFLRKKEARLRFRINQELHKWKVLALPQYNELLDAFEPNLLPEDPDSYFKR